MPMNSLNILNLLIVRFCEYKLRLVPKWRMNDVFVSGIMMYRILSIMLGRYI